MLVCYNILLLYATIFSSMYAPSFLGSEDPKSVLIILIFLSCIWFGFFAVFFIQPLSPLPIFLSSASILLPACGLKRTHLLLL